jgi:hypothetical protein
MYIKASGDTVKFKINITPEMVSGTFYISLKEGFDDQNIVISKNVDNDNTCKEIYISFDSIETKDLLGLYYFDVRYKDIDNNIISLAIDEEIEFREPITIL